MAKLFKNNGLTIVLLALFLVTILGQWIAGWHVENEELLRHGGEAISLGAYLVDPAFPPRCSRIGRASSCRCPPMSC